MLVCPPQVNLGVVPVRSVCRVPHWFVELLLLLVVVAVVALVVVAPAAVLVLVTALRVSTLLMSIAMLISTESVILWLPSECWSSLSGEVCLEKPRVVSVACLT